MAELTPLHHPLTVDQQKTLMAGLNPNRVANRKQGGASLSYLEAWDVKAALIRVFGFGGFSATADECQILHLEDNIPRPKWVDRKKVGVEPIEYDHQNKVVPGTANFRVTAKVRVTLTIHALGAVYSEYAVASQTGPDIGEVADFAVKTAESDALKRAAIYLGTQFGLSLYDNGSTKDVVRVVLAPGQEWHPAHGPIRDGIPEQKASPEKGGPPAPSVAEATGNPAQSEDELQKAEQFVAQALSAKKVAE